MKCPIIKKCGGCFYPQDQYQEELKEKTLFIEKEIKKTKLKIDVKPTVASPLVNGYRNKAIVLIKNMNTVSTKNIAKILFLINTVYYTKILWMKSYNIYKAI